MSNIIHVDDVSKIFQLRQRQAAGFAAAVKSFFAPAYKEVRAVDGISFKIDAGEAVGYLGPNGAGKSTMIKMMTGILVPSAGKVSVLQRTPHTQRLVNSLEIGVVFGQRSQLWWDLPVRDSFELHRRMYQIDDARFKHNLALLSEMLGIAPFIDRPVRQLSLGQKMRVEIAMSLLHNPKVLFLDEPTIGLDVVAKDAVRKFLTQVNREQGVTIILTTHDLQDIEQICPRLIMVDEGKLLFDGALSELRSAFGGRRKLTLEFQSDPGPVRLRRATALAGGGIRQEFLLDSDAATLVDIMSELGQRHMLKDIAIEAPDIEEVIRTYYQTREKRSDRLAAHV
ncbi:ABC-2 type transport system ATP-binding protein [Rhizobium tibeticum]|uniref:ABC transporter ATP-binding protein n=1 Tax=Rhizobium tibeticum TaxID=501024 RepID=UPI00278AC18C|nr:ATP-binding cassette domain-containing protein [Rhizobium tibeticum]MDP9811193.1 ABC-2 type transport system ATP-binding protein [Rhizobium tibeticum]